MHAREEERTVRIEVFCSHLRSWFWRSPGTLVDFRVDQPLVAFIRERFSDSDDMLLVGVRFGRRFGR